MQLHQIIYWRNFHFLLCNLGLSEFGDPSAQRNSDGPVELGSETSPGHFLPSLHAESIAREGVCVLDQGTDHNYQDERRLLLHNSGMRAVF